MDTSRKLGTTVVIEIVSPPLWPIAVMPEVMTLSFNPPKSLFQTIAVVLREIAANNYLDAAHLLPEFTQEQIAGASLRKVRCIGAEVQAIFTLREGKRFKRQQRATLGDYLREVPDEEVFLDIESLDQFLVQV